MDVKDPFARDAFARVACVSSAKFESAVPAATRAFPARSKTPSDERRHLAPKLADRLEDKAGKFARTRTRDEGRPPNASAFEYGDVEDALAPADNTRFGLDASVRGDDLGCANAGAQRVASGTVWTNHHMHFAAEVPFGGAKEGEAGADYGEEGLAVFTQLKAVSDAK